MNVHHMCAWYIEGIGSPATGAALQVLRTDSPQEQQFS